jgi:MFS family permease
LFYTAFILVFLSFSKPPNTTMPSLSRFAPFASSTTAVEAATYLLGISLFSISFLVFLNSSVSFVVTDLIGQKHGVGDVVGTLGFADELVALVACPAWGLLSDRLGVRWVATIGYAIIGVALAIFVQAKNVYPQLLLARVFFALGASAA